jgi:hypothetical protein
MGIEVLWGFGGEGEEKLRQVQSCDVGICPQFGDGRALMFSLVGERLYFADFTLSLDPKLLSMGSSG